MTTTEPAIRSDDTIADRPWETLQSLIASGDTVAISTQLDALSAADTALALSRLETDDQHKLLTLLNPAEAANLLEEVPQAQAADLIEELTPAEAAAIFAEVSSDQRADLLAEIDDAEDAEAILQAMPTESAAQIRELMAYDPDSAGGLMVTELVRYPQDLLVEDVVNDLRQNRDRYADFAVQYMYIVDREDQLTGILRIRDLLFTSPQARLEKIMIRSPLSVRSDDSLEALRDFFTEHDWIGVPVTNARNKLVGVVRQEDLEEALGQAEVDRYLNISGILGGEEYRSMPLFSRCGRRLSWLSINIVLNIVAASVIAAYQDTLTAVIALAVFLPMISDMSGCSGNQAVAVSMRELSLGLVRPGEFWRVFFKEAGLGMINGLVLGILLGTVAWFWKDNTWLGLVVGSALMINTLVAVTLGGMLPLIFKSLKMDPALVSGPILTTVTDMCGFFLVLSLASRVLPHLQQMM